MKAVQRASKEAALRSRLEEADVVVVGRVKAVRPSSVQALSGPTAKRITEHDPDWQEAVVQVETSLKPPVQNPELVIRFPGSKDVAWFGVPKFRVGQEGTFILRKDQLSGAPTAMLAGAKVDAYSALTDGDVLPKTEAATVRALLK